MSAPEYCRRLIEIDLPIKVISEHARREKSVGRYSMMHAWWARRPLAACRAVILAALWPDPTDPKCPERFQSEAARQLQGLRDRRGGAPRNLGDAAELRDALFRFIGEFANPDLADDKLFLAVSRTLVQVAHESLGGARGTRPLLIDPFAGGGAIPVEALRVGADVFASDLNPVAVLLNKVVLELFPKYREQLAQEVRKWGEWVREDAQRQLSEWYPKDKDGATTIAYLWARTMRCEGPGCGAEIPLLRSLWLSKKDERSAALRLLVNKTKKQIDFEIQEGVREKDVNQGTIRKGSASCPICGFTTKVGRVRAQLRERRGGSRDARLLAVVIAHPLRGRNFRLATAQDIEAYQNAATVLDGMKRTHKGQLSLVPNEPLPPNGTLGFRVQKYGMLQWGDLFNPRQSLALITVLDSIRKAQKEMLLEHADSSLSSAVCTCLALTLDRLAEHSTSLCRWNASSAKMQATFGRQALPMVWDFCEANPFGRSVGDWDALVSCVLSSCESVSAAVNPGTVAKANAVAHPLPNDAANATVTDPPYYDAVPYADLSDFFYVWLRRSVGDLHPSLFATQLTPKDGECVVNPLGLADDGPIKDRAQFALTMQRALSEARRVTRLDGICIVVFAHKSTAGWEAQLQAMIEAGWIITASWPIDTEMGSRLRAQSSAALASSIHLVCRPRADSEDSLGKSAIGDWRDVLSELPKRIHEWMPRLANEGIVGADAIFACLGPALEVFSRYSRVEKASGEGVSLKEYLEQVWAAVAREALERIFDGADTTGFEEDARLTAMWLWTLSAAGSNGDVDEEAVEDDENDTKGRPGRFALEFDAARKIAQGLGAHLEELNSLVQIKGETARLLPVAERTRALFGKDSGRAPRAQPRKKQGQLKLGFVEDPEPAEEEARVSDVSDPEKGVTVLDRVHQAMIFFGAGKGEALRRFLVNEGVGRDNRFWRLAQALSALYPASTDEKRWIDGVLARKKGLGF